MPSIFALSERNKGPVCECDDWHCREPLGLSWADHAAYSRGRVLVSKACGGGIPSGIVRDLGACYSVAIPDLNTGDLPLTEAAPVISTDAAITGAAHA